MSRLRGLGALTHAFLLETWRGKWPVFWNLVFPLFSLVGFSYIFGNGEPERVAYILPGILTINLITASFFGISLHMVSLREREVYRRFRVTPLAAMTLILAHAATALVNILLSVSLQVLLAVLLFRISIVGSAQQLAVATLLGAFAFIPLGLLVGSMARDMKTAPALSNLIFFPMMFLSGAAMPLHMMPAWLQRAAVFLPATYVVELLRAALVRGDTFEGLPLPAFVLISTGLVGFAFNALLFRWESQQPISRRGLALAVACLAVIYTAVYLNGTELKSARPPEVRAASPPAPGGTPAPAPKPGAGAQILTGMTLLDGLGGRLERARVLIKGGRIVEVGPEGGSLPEGVPVTDLTGLYMIPGLVDSHVHVGGSGGGSVSSAEYAPPRFIHDLQVYLATGITSFVSMTDHIEDLYALRRVVAAGTMRAPRPYFSGPGITAPRGHPARFFEALPGLPAYMTRQVSTEQAAAAAVQGLTAIKMTSEDSTIRVDFVKIYLDAGRAGDPSPPLPEPALRAAIRAARQVGLRTTVHVDDDRHARLAVDAGADGIEHVPPDLSDETIAAMLSKGVTLTPTLSAAEGLAKTLNGEQISDPLALKYVEPYVIESLQSPASWIAKVRASPEAVAHYARRYESARGATRRAVAAGVRVLAGSDAGNPASFHGPGLLRELELLVEEGGMNPSSALVAATGAAGQRLGTDEIGRIAPGAFADLVILGADPTKDIRALRDVRTVYFGGTAFAPEMFFSTSPGTWRPVFGWPSQRSGS
jgi:imidazolonepropionase-like amidohydrolase/ABC-type multidrug transport system permease subunit